ncbi:MAG: acyltransferase [Pseudomonadota bacterium]
MLLYKHFLKECGKSTIIKTPMFWMPEYMSIGKNVLIWPSCRIEAINRYGKEEYTPHIIIGDYVNIQQNCHITAADELRIGNETTISFGVSIQDTDHEYQQINVNILQQPLLVKKTTIGENCFIGSGAKILAGTVLGRQCIVGANAVVRGIFPDYCVIAGIPAKIIKRYNLETKEWARTNAIGEFVNGN